MMERLTERTTDGSGGYKIQAKNLNSHCVAKDKRGYITYYGQHIDKLAEYEDFEEIFREKMTDTACDFLSDKEEFGKWLDRNKWIVKKCDEWVRAEEQGLLLRLPCAIGSTLYQPIDSRINEYKVIGLCFDILNNKWMYEVAYEVGFEWHKTVCNFNYIGKTVFLTQAEAEQKLKEMESD